MSLGKLDGKQGCAKRPLGAEGGGGGVFLNHKKIAINQGFCDWWQVKISEMDVTINLIDNIVVSFSVKLPMGPGMVFVYFF